MNGFSGPVVVGVDGSPAGGGALHWAAREAAARGLPLRVLHAAGSADTQLWAAARAMVAEAVSEARTARPDLEVQGDVVDGAPITELCAASRESSLLVLASRGIGGFPELLLGSVASQLALHGRCPVVIVHDAEVWSGGDASAAGELPVVVGANSSPDSDEAIGAAFAAAKARGVPLIAVRTWRPQMVAHRGEIRRARADDSAVSGAKHYAVSEAVAPWRAKYPDVRVEIRVAVESAAAALVAASREAQLLVLGSHGHGQGDGARLGATTHQVLNHAHCPVMVVRLDASEEA